MKHLLILIVLVYGSSGGPLEKDDGKKDIDGEEGDKILEATGFFIIKQADERWFIEVYKADTVRGTKILYCELFEY